MNKLGLPTMDIDVMLEQVGSGKSFVIKPNGDIDEFKGKFTLDSLYEALGCEMIEVVNLKDDLILICDEEALYKVYPVVNMIATKMYREAYGTDEVGIIGRCIICQSSKLS
jgi:hypothetical protein